jgi:predicted RecB family nuclease
MKLSCLITPDIVTAFDLCQRKAFLLLRGDVCEETHPYYKLIEKIAVKSLNSYIDTLMASGIKVRGKIVKGEVNTNVLLRSEDIEATADVLTCIYSGSPETHKYFEPHLVLGTNTVTKEHKIRLAFVGYVLAETQHFRPVTGTIVSSTGQHYRIQLSKLMTEIISIIEVIRNWKTNPKAVPPSIFINNNCPLCPFKNCCLTQAEKEENLSLLDRMTPKLMQKYHRKGIFTVTQLSYLFKPRRQRQKRKQQPTAINLELQALALRTGKIYLHQPPVVPENGTELFLDIEGVPDRNTYYLIGLIVSARGELFNHSLWADSSENESSIFIQLQRIVAEYPDAPIYHYGSYEPNALKHIEKKYSIVFTALKKRLVNVNSFIFGKVYFPTRSNSLKELGKFIGATWTSSDASGLQSIVWRLKWEVDKSDSQKKQLITYNIEDCLVLQRLVNELRNIGLVTNSRSDVDFADTPNQSTTPAGKHIHDLFEGVLKSAHAEYKIKRIGVGQHKAEDQGDLKKRGAPMGHQGFHRIIPVKAGSVKRVRRPTKCPKHTGQALLYTDKIAEHTVIDLNFTRNGCHKTVTKYTGTMGHCPQCHRDYAPPSIRRFNRQLFGHSFRAWIVYQRITLRLPYNVISQVIEDMFSEHVSQGTIVNFMVNLAEYYASTEKMHLKSILKSPFIHADETTINIQGVDHYVWVLTNGTHVVFRLTETREATLIQEILDGFEGVLISDFYSGYDACKCRQQKCLVHLIRDLNDDLWKNPFDTEFEVFVSAFKDVLVLIMADIEKYGMKLWYLKKHKQRVDQFYDDIITGCVFKSEITLKYQKRFHRYKESLFLFLEVDGIPWNNNTAERAIRHLAVQRKISGTFYKQVAPQYLRLLGIAQTVRFQEKSFLEFLLSGKKNVDMFKARKRHKSSKQIDSAKVLMNKSAMNQAEVLQEIIQ